MKKALISVIVLISLLVLGVGALAADVKISGELGYNVEKADSDFDDVPVGAQYVSYRLTLDSVISDKTSAKLELKGIQSNRGTIRAAPPTSTFTTATITTKIDGAGTISAGINPDYGTSPFSNITIFDSRRDLGVNGVWGVKYDEAAPAVSFASEKFSGFAGQIYLNPWSEDFDNRQIATEVTYDLPVFEGATAGLAYSKDSLDDYSNWALIGNVPVNENVTLYGEVGKVAGSDDINDKAFGARAKVGAATLAAEAHLDDENAYYFAASYPFQDFTLDASYMTGDAWGSYRDGLFKFSAKLAF